MEDGRGRMRRAKDRMADENAEEIVWQDTSSMIILNGDGPETTTEGKDSRTPPYRNTQLQWLGDLVGIGCAERVSSSATLLLLLKKKKDTRKRKRKRKEQASS